MDAERAVEERKTKSEEIKKAVYFGPPFQIYLKENYFLKGISSETVRRFLPLALLLVNTFLPFLELMRSLKPCLFFLFLREGWNVRFMLFTYKRVANVGDLF